jgi:hypothetical protein
MSKQDHQIDDTRFYLEREICEQVQVIGAWIHHRVYVKHFLMLGNHRKLSDEEYDCVV